MYSDRGMLILINPFFCNLVGKVTLKVITTVLPTVVGFLVIEFLVIVFGDREVNVTSVPMVKSIELITETTLPLSN